MKLTITHKVNKEIKSFYHIYSSICHKDQPPLFLDKCKDKLPNNPKINDLIKAWDNLGLSTDFLDLAGCILSDQSHVHVSPNGRRLTEHAAIHVKPSSSKGIEVTTNVTISSLVPNKGEMVTKELVSLKSKFGETSIIVKCNTKFKLLHDGQMLDPKIYLYSECKDDLDVWFKKFCLKTVHSGVNKLVSNNASIEFDESVMDGVREYHASVLSNLEINNCEVAPFPKVQLNKNNISEVQSAIFKAFKKGNDDSNPYAMLNKHYGKYYSIMHDSIQEFFFRN